MLMEGRKGGREEGKKEGKIKLIIGFVILESS